MKKLILSAVFALACFTAQAQTKDMPKNGVANTTMRYPDSDPAYCYKYGSVTLLCGNTWVACGFVKKAGTCEEAQQLLDDALATASCNTCK